MVRTNGRKVSQGVHFFPYQWVPQHFLGPTSQGVGRPSEEVLPKAEKGPSWCKPEAAGPQTTADL